MKQQGIIAGQISEDPEDESGESPSEETREHSSREELPDEAAIDAEGDPAFQSALRFAMTALYENGGAKKVAEQIQSSQDKTKTISDIAYQMVSIVDERTNGNVPEELLALLGIRVLEEVADICEAAGYGCAPEDIAQAFKDMVLRFVSDQGYDTAALRQAMDSVDPSEIVKAAGGEESEAAETLSQESAEPEDEEND